MSANQQSLTEKEKQTLRLIVRGHDAKSMARHLGLSVHTVNERLRDARRKLEVSSSREAARKLFESESTTPESLVDTQFGEAAVRKMEDKRDFDTHQMRPKRASGVIAGVIIMSIFTVVAALFILTGGTGPAAVSQSTSPVAAVESDAVRAARDWLVLGDQGRWNDGWLATASSFRKANTAAQWADAATKVRVPMGALISRTVLGQESIPAPPAGVEVVKFRSSFANRADVTETVSLARESGAWRVVGIYVD